MHVDHLVLACLRDRLDALLGARVQRVVLPDEHSVGLELYAGKRFHLHISAHPQRPRMLLVPERIRRGVQTSTPLLLLLRKWVRGSRLVDVVQPPWERILSLQFQGEAGPCQLVAELIGRYSNLILVGPDGHVLEASKHVGPDINRYRVTLPAHPYVPPPQPPSRRPPTAVSVPECASLLRSEDADRPLHRILTGNLFGVSPTAAREVATRAAGSSDAKAQEASPTKVVEALQQLFSPLDDGAWAPHLALDEKGCAVAFASYELRQFAYSEPVASISYAMWRYFQEQEHVDADTYATARQRVRDLIERAVSAVEHALRQVRDQQVSQERVDALREMGELLLTYQHRVNRGAERITVPGYDGEPRSIELDPRMTPVENAKRYFRRYRKAARAAKSIPLRIQALETDLAYLRQLSADLTLAESRPEIDAVHETLVEAGWAEKKPKQSSSAMARQPRRFDVGQFPVFVGRNARQNDDVTFRRGSRDDLWLHVRGLPGAHVLIKTGGRPVPDHAVRQAASLAAYYSSARDEDLVDVDVTERRFVKRAPGGRPGMVTYRQEQTLLVEPKPIP